MTRKDKRHGHGAHGQGHGPHHQLDPQDPKPPGEVINPPSPAPGEDVDIRGIARFAAGLLVVVVLSSGLMFLLMRQLGRHSAAQDPGGPPPPGQPRSIDTEHGQPLTRPDGGVRLQRDPFRDMDERREHDRRVLREYGWVDRPTEVVRLPIEVAKRLVVSRGLPARAPVAEAGPIPVSAVAVATPRPRPTAVAPRPTRRPAPRPAAAPAAPAPEGGA